MFCSFAVFRTKCTKVERVWFCGVRNSSTREAIFQDANVLEEALADGGRLRSSRQPWPSADLTPAERRDNGLPNSLAWLAEDVDAATDRAVDGAAGAVDRLPELQLTKLLMEEQLIELRILDELLLTVPQRYLTS